MKGKPKQNRTYARKTWLKETAAWWRSGILMDSWSICIAITRTFGSRATNKYCKLCSVSMLESSPSASGYSFINFVLFNSVSRFWLEFQIYWPFSSLFGTRIPKCLLSKKVTVTVNLWFPVLPFILSHFPSVDCISKIYFEVLQLNQLLALTCLPAFSSSKLLAAH